MTRLATAQCMDCLYTHFSRLVEALHACFNLRMFYMDLCVFCIILIVVIKLNRMYIQQNMSSTSKFAQEIIVFIWSVFCCFLWNQKRFAVDRYSSLLLFFPPAKPISLVERCYCRSTVNNLPRGYIRELRFIHTPNCPFQVMWVLFLMPALSGWHPHHTNTQNCAFSSLTLKHQTFPRRWTFLTINLREVTGQRKELCTHAPLSLVFARMHRKQVVFTTGPLTHPQELLHLSVSEREREVEIGRSFVFNRKAIVVGFLIGFTPHLLVTQHFLLILCLQPLGLISFIVTARVEWI